MHKIVSLDTKNAHIVFILVFLMAIFFVVNIFCSSHCLSFYAHADQSIDERPIYYVKQFNVGEQEFGLGYDINSSIFFYPSLNVLINSLLSQHPKSNIFFEDVVNVNETIEIDNIDNKITNEEIELTLSGNLGSIVKGGAYNGVGPNSNTYAMKLLGDMKVIFETLTFSSKTVAINVFSDVYLDILDSSIVASAEYRNEFDAGALLNNGHVNIKSSIVEWLDQSVNVEYLPNWHDLDPDPKTKNPAAKGYAVFNYGNIYIDEGVPSNFSTLRGNGAVAVQDGGHITIYNGQLINTNNASGEGFKTLFVFNATADILGGELLCSDESQVEQPIVIKQSEVSFSGDFTVQKNIFIASEDLNTGSKVSIGEVTIETIPGAYNIEINAEAENGMIQPEIAPDKINISIVGFDPERVDSNGWGNEYGDTISLLDAQTFFTTGNMQPDITFIFYVTYIYFDIFGQIKSTVIPLREGDSHVISARKGKYISSVLMFSGWREMERPSNFFNDGEEIFGINRDYNLEEELFLQPFDLEEIADLSGPLPVGDIVLTADLSVYPSDDITFTYSWSHKAEESGIFSAITDETSSQILLDKLSPNGYYRLDVTATLAAPGGPFTHHESIEFFARYSPNITYFWLSDSGEECLEVFSLDVGESHDILPRKSTYHSSLLTFLGWQELASSDNYYQEGDKIVAINRNYNLKEKLCLKSFDLEEIADLSGPLPVGDIILTADLSVYPCNDVAFTYSWSRKAEESGIFSAIIDETSSQILLDKLSPNGYYRLDVTATLAVPGGPFTHVEWREFSVNFDLLVDPSNPVEPLIPLENNPEILARRNTITTASIALVAGIMTFLSALFVAFSRVIIPIILKKISKR